MVGSSLSHFGKLASRCGVSRCSMCSRAEIPSQPGQNGGNWDGGMVLTPTKEKRLDTRAAS
jgi:hypothetical protein